MVEKNILRLLKNTKNHNFQISGSIESSLDDESLAKVPEEIMSKYTDGTRTAYLSKPVDEELKVPKAYFVEDHNDYREYWKGFEVVEWKDGSRHLRACYWTRERGTQSWIWGQFSLIISQENLQKLLKMMKDDPF